MSTLHPKLFFYLVFYHILTNYIFTLFIPGPTIKKIVYESIFISLLIQTIHILLYLSRLPNRNKSPKSTLIKENPQE